MAESTFAIKPDDLIELAKKAVGSQEQNFTTNSDLVDQEEFVFKAPFVGPISYQRMAAALKNFAFDDGFPASFQCLHNFWVDPYEPSRVWYTQR